MQYIEHTTVIDTAYKNVMYFKMQQMTTIILPNSS